MILALAIIAALVMPAAAQPPINSITSCTTISKSGAYEVDSALTSSTPGNCLVIKASNVTLNLNHFSITGLGGGVGLYIEGSNAFVEGNSAAISGFLYGVEISGSSAFFENFSANSNGTGVYLNNAKQARVADFVADSNVSDGVRVSKGTLNNLQNPNCQDNGRYGIWLYGTTHNTVGSFFLQNNTEAGLYVGCSNSGPQGQKCKPAVAASSYNYIYGGTTGGAQAYGVAIDLGDNDNRVADNISQFNSVLDLYDANADCANNLWLSDVFGDSNQPPPPDGCVR